MKWKQSARTSVVVTAVGLALCSVPAGGAGAAVTSTCSHLTRTQIQPLVGNRVTKLTVTPVPGILYGSSAKQVGQTCDFADTATSNALTVVVITGATATRAYRSELHRLGHSLARVPVVSGGKAMRQRADSRGAVSTAEVASIKGSTYCAVTPGDVAPGEARLERAAGGTADIGDKAYADISAAIGTVCNRIYGSGNTNPAPALAALKKIKPKHSGGGITVPAFPPSP